MNAPTVSEIWGLQSRPWSPSRFPTPLRAKPRRDRGSTICPLGDIAGDATGGGSFSLGPGRFEVDGAERADEVPAAADRVALRAGDHHRLRSAGPGRSRQG